MKNKNSQRGSITVFVLLACLFFIVFLTGMFMLGAVKRQVQIEATKQTENIYSQGNENEIYNDYFAEGAIPIYTKAQLEKMCSGEQIAINEEGGKIYTFSADAVYLLKEDIAFEYNGVWQMPTNFGDTGRIEGNGKRIIIKDTSKSEEIFYYYTEDNQYEFPLTKEGYAYSNLMLHYDGINNTGDGHSDTVTTWKDLSGNGYNGVLNQFTDSNHWEANQLRFDGIDDYIDTFLPQASIGNSITISAVCLAEDISNYRGLFGPHFAIGVDENSAYGGILMQFGYGNISAGMTHCDATIPAQEYICNKIILTCVMEDGKPSKIYIGDELISEGSDSAVFSPILNLEIGRSMALDDRYWLGTVSNFMVYNKLLTEEEIAYNYKVSTERFKLRKRTT